MNNNSKNLNEPIIAFLQVPKVQNDYVKLLSNIRTIANVKTTYNFNEIGCQNQLKFLINHSILR